MRIAKTFPCFVHHWGWAIGVAFATIATNSVAQTSQTPDNTYTETINIGIKTTGDNPWHLEMTYDRPIDVMQEYTPEGQTGRDWSEMITVMSLKNRPEVNVGQVIIATIQRFRTTCANVQILEAKESKEVDELRQSQGLPSSYRIFTALVRCDDPKSAPNPNVLLKKHEVVWFKGMQGWLTSYLVQRAWHADDLPPDSVLESDKTKGEWREWLSRVKVRGLPDDKLLGVPNAPSGN